MDPLGVLFVVWQANYTTPKGEHQMSFDCDEEVPAGYQDADIEQAQFEEEGRRLAALHRRGICTHGWQLGGKIPAIYDAEDIAASRAVARFPDRPTDESVTTQADIPDGKCLCLDCGQLVDDPLAGRR